MKHEQTASGETLDPDHQMTAAHRTWPFGTRVTLTNPRNGRSVEVRVNDRGPFTAGRELDITTAAARALGFKGTGLLEVSSCHFPSR